MLVDQSGFNMRFLYVMILQCKIGDELKTSCDLALFLSYSLITQHFPNTHTRLQDGASSPSPSLPNSVTSCSD